MRINTNIMALNAYSNLEDTSRDLSSSLEKLSSGYRINKAADDTSGLVISEHLKSQVSGLQQATSNAQNGISVVQTAEGALSSVQSMLQRIRDLVIESANTAASDSTARRAAQNEIVQLRNEIDRVANTTSFGNEHLLDGSFGAQEARAAKITTGLAAGVVVTATSPTFDLNIDSGAETSLSVTVTVNAGTYATAASYQAELQSDASAQTAAHAGFTGSVTVNVRDLGGGAWSVEFVRNTIDGTGTLAVKNVGTTNGGALAGVSAATIVNNSGVFQVGANVTSNDQISLSINDMRITNGTDGAFTSLAGIDVTNTSIYASAQTLVDGALDEVSNDRGQLGAVQNRFESTISNLQVTTQNLSASESQIADTDMSLEMLNFTNDQILLQAGTAMLSQANAVPQTILKLLQ